jgi:hypothetical protein
MSLRLAAAAALLLVVGCQRAQTQLDAAEDIRGFLTAVRENDRGAFEARVDRAALKADLTRQFQSQAGRGDPASLLLGSAAGEQLLDQLIAPETFSFAMSKAAPTLNRTPTAPEIAASLKTLSPERVCLPSGGPDGPCAITFAKSGGAWKLVGIAAGGAGVQQIPFPPSAAG